MSGKRKMKSFNKNNRDYTVNNPDIKNFINSISLNDSKPTDSSECGSQLSLAGLRPIDRKKLTRQNLIFLLLHIIL